MQDTFARARDDRVSCIQVISVNNVKKSITKFKLKIPYLIPLLYYTNNPKHFYEF